MRESCGDGIVEGGLERGGCRGKVVKCKARRGMWSGRRFEEGVSVTYLPNLLRIL